MENSNTCFNQLLIEQQVKSLKKALLRLDDFCKENKIEYMVTGTMALSMLGVPSNLAPNDIDIKVFHLKKEQADKLTELQFLSGLENEEYDKCYSFRIDGIKVNALVCKEDDYDAILAQSISVNVINEKKAKWHTIGIQLVTLALIDKMKLNRDKDRAYMLNLINILSAL